VTLNRSLFIAAGLASALGSAALHAEQPAPIESRKANRADAAPQYQSDAPPGSTQRAAEALNKRDTAEIEKRRRDGDDDPETRDGIRIESTPDHPGENDGKP
jgi:hypothetical protein